jgi:hypothetical protein
MADEPTGHLDAGGVMLIDCDNCEVRDIACGGCVVLTVLGAPSHGVEIDEGELRALDVLADVGLVPPLRHTVPAPASAAGGRGVVPGTPNRRVS